MLANYDKASTWELPTACRSGAVSTPRPDDQIETFATFPEALQWFLGDAGYTPPAYLAPAGASGPSFPCTSVRSEVLKLVCATPELSKADRQLAELYGRATALSSDPNLTRQAQRQFIATRNNAPADVFALLRLYQARIGALSVDSE